MPRITKARRKLVTSRIPRAKLGRKVIWIIVPCISEETIQRVAEANDIVEVISSYFPLKRAGTSWRALCPFHRDAFLPCESPAPILSLFRLRRGRHRLSIRDGLRTRGLSVSGSPARPTRRRSRRRGGRSAQDDRTALLRKRLLALHAEAAAWFHENLLSPQRRGSPDVSAVPKNFDETANRGCLAMLRISKFLARPSAQPAILLRRSRRAGWPWQRRKNANRQLDVWRPVVSTFPWEADVSDSQRLW